MAVFGTVSLFRQPRERANPESITHWIDLSNSESPNNLTTVFMFHQSPSVLKQWAVPSGCTLFLSLSEKELRNDVRSEFSLYPNIPGFVASFLDSPAQSVHGSYITSVTVRKH